MTYIFLLTSNNPTLAQVFSSLNDLAPTKFSSIELAILLNY